MRGCERHARSPARAGAAPTPAPGRCQASRRPAVPAHPSRPASSGRRGGGRRHDARWALTCRSTEGAVQSEAASPAGQPGFLFGAGPSGAWDAGGVGSPVVRCFMGDDEQRWYMWYDGHASRDAGGSPPASAIGLAISADGISWRRAEAAGAPGEPGTEGQVLGPNADWWWHDTRSVGVSDVQIFSSDAVNVGVGVYWMFYSGSSFEPAPTPAGMPGLAPGQEVEGLRTRVGLAMSQDGRNWARIEADHHTGALFDAGEEGQWDAALNAKPQVLALGPSDMRMYYHAFCGKQRRWVVGSAASRDGFVWRKHGPVFGGGGEGGFDALGAASHCVVKDADSKRFVMFYEAVAADGARSISLAVSRDGLRGWRRLGRPLLQASGAGRWDGGGVGCPCAVPMADGKWRLFYAGQEGREGPWQGVGLAITDPDSIDTFEGVRIGFKRRTAKA